jgi:hypothetical protein
VVLASHASALLGAALSAPPQILMRVLLAAVALDSSPAQTRRRHRRLPASSLIRYGLPVDLACTLAEQRI